jgi:hypothetical protein
MCSTTRSTTATRFVTPHQRHDGQDDALLARRAQVYEAAKAANPQRWSGATRNWQPVREVHLNPDQSVHQKNGQKEENSQFRKTA